MDSDRVLRLPSKCWARKGTADPNQQIQLSFSVGSWFSSNSSLPMQEVLAKGKKY